MAGKNKILVSFGLEHLTIEEIGLIANLKAHCVLSSDSRFKERIHNGPKLLKKLIANKHVVYGVNTGVGENCIRSVSDELLAELPGHVIQFHGCCLGELFDERQTRAILAARLISLTKGYSAVRMDILEQLISLLEHDVLPRIPQEGSVGASGDLSPLSYIGAVISGHRTVLYNNEVLPADEALKKIGRKPLVLEGKEALGILNGTSAMTGVACLAWLRAKELSQIATRITSLMILALKGNLFHYDKTLFSGKNHPGQQLVAKRIRQDLCISDATQDYSKAVRIQDRYSLRCAPQVIGVIEDVLTFTKTVIEAELNSTNDNPIIDVDTERVFHGGMFYGGHIAMAMDTLKCQVANIADLLDRQMASLVNPLHSNGLPANLVGAVGPRLAINHGLMGLHITISGWTAEALKHTMPASVFSRSTENHNQDKVSMGTIAARDCVRVLQLTEQVVAGVLIGLRQALALREEMNGEGFAMSANTKEFMETIRKDVDFITEDVFLEPVLRQVIKTITNLPSMVLYND